MFILILIVFLNGKAVDVEISNAEIKTHGRCHQIGLATGATLEEPHNGIQYVCASRKDLVN